MNPFRFILKICLLGCQILHSIHQLVAKSVCVQLVSQSISFYKVEESLEMY